MRKVTVYTRPLCGFCVRALTLLKEKGAEVIEICTACDKEKHEEMLVRSNGKRTFPQIFVGDTHVGGSDELAALDRAGKLDVLFHDE